MKVDFFVFAKLSVGLLGLFQTDTLIKLVKHGFALQNSNNYTILERSESTSSKEPRFYDLPARNESIISLKSTNV